MLHSICQQIWNTQQWPQDWKRSVFIPTPKKGNARECSNYRTIALISHASKVMLKILQARLQQYMTKELPDVQAGFRKGRGTRDQIAYIHWTIEKQENSRKTSTSASSTTLKPLTVWITINCGKLLQMGIPDQLTCLLRNLYSGQEATKLEPDMGQQTGSKLGKECVKAVFNLHVYLTYVQSTLFKMPGWIKHKLESRLPGETSITSDMQMTPPLWQKEKN